MDILINKFIVTFTTAVMQSFHSYSGADWFSGRETSYWSQSKRPGHHGYATVATRRNQVDPQPADRAAVSSD